MAQNKNNYIEVNLEKGLQEKKAIVRTEPGKQSVNMPDVNNLKVIERQIGVIEKQIVGGEVIEVDDIQDLPHDFVENIKPGNIIFDKSDFYSYLCSYVDSAEKDFTTINESYTKTVIYLKNGDEGVWEYDSSNEYEINGGGSSVIQVEDIYDLPSETVEGIKGGNIVFAADQENAYLCVLKNDTNIGFVCVMDNIVKMIYYSKNDSQQWELNGSEEYTIPLNVGLEIVGISGLSGTLTDGQYNKLNGNNAVLKAGTQYFYKNYDASTLILYTAAPKESNGKIIVDQYEITKSTKAYEFKYFEQDAGLTEQDLENGVGPIELKRNSNSTNYSKGLLFDNGTNVGELNYSHQDLNTDYFKFNKEVRAKEFYSLEQTPIWWSDYFSDPGNIDPIYDGSLKKFYDDIKGGKYIYYDSQTGYHHRLYLVNDSPEWYDYLSEHQEGDGLFAVGTIPLVDPVSELGNTVKTYIIKFVVHYAEPEEPEDPDEEPADPVLYVSAYELEKTL